MKKLLSILPLTLALCGCSAFTPVALDNATIDESQNASFVGDPKRIISDVSQVYGYYEFTFDIHGTDYYDHGWENPFMVVNQQQVDIGEGWVACSANNSNLSYDVRGDLEEGQIVLALNMTWLTTDEVVKNGIVNGVNASLGGSPYQNFSYSGPASTSAGVDLNWIRRVPLSDSSYSLSFTLYSPMTFTGTYTRCYATSVEGYNRFPTAPYYEVSNPYRMKFTANTGCYFPSENGGLASSVISSVNLTNKAISDVIFYVNSDEIQSFVFQADLDAVANASLNVTANLRSVYGLTLNLTRCNAVGSFPTSFRQGESFSITIECEEDYSFNSLTSSVHVTGVSNPNIVYSDAIFGNLFQKVTISFNVEKSSVLIRAVGVSYSNDYESGWNNGLSEGMSGSNFFGWIRNIFDGMANFFGVQIFPGISLGLIAFSPLLVLAIIVIVRIFKHGG